MISLKEVIVILLSILYGIALASATTLEFDSKHKKLYRFSNLIFTLACLTSLSFMSAVFEIKKSIEYVCYVNILVIILIAPMIKKLIIAKLSRKQK